jgi:hypothetical protein
MKPKVTHSQNIGDFDTTVSSSNSTGRSLAPPSPSPVRNSSVTSRTRVSVRPGFAMQLRQLLRVPLRPDRVNLRAETNRKTPVCVEVDRLRYRNSSALAQRLAHANDAVEDDLARSAAYPRERGDSRVHRDHAREIWSPELQLGSRPVSCSILPHEGICADLQRHCLYGRRPCKLMI